MSVAERRTPGRVAPVVNGSLGKNGEGDFFLISLKAGGTGLNLTAADILDDTGSSSLSSEILMDLLKGGQDTKTKKRS